MPNVLKQTRRLTRCRTGCDEGKPKCQNCTDRGFNCQYGPQLTFLTKNAHTVESSEVGAASATYESIQFINEDPPKEEDDAESLKDRSSSPEDDLRIHRERKREPHHSSSDTHAQSLDVELPQWEADGPSSQGISLAQPSKTLFNHNDESAVAGLLALGTSTQETMAPRSLTFSEFAISQPTKEPSVTQAMAPARNTDFPTVISPDRVAIATPSTLAISSTQTLELIRHYRYEVAPWLDICDLGQFFGIQGLQLAMVSQPVWHSVLALSEASMNLLRPFSSLVITDKTPGAPATPEMQLDITTLAFLRAIDESKNCILNFQATWSPQRVCDKELLDSLGPQTIRRDLNSAIYWLFVRHDLAAALATDTDIQVPLLPSLPYLTGRDFETDPFEHVFCFAHRPLWLCTKAVQFVHNDDPSPQNPPLRVWMDLMEELEQWYQERPQGFQPMMEIELEGQATGQGQGFPVVLFAHGSGVFSNQLYHTAMLLLLHNRPRTAPTPGYHSTTMSPLWHAQRICSISVNNDRQECWDPVLLASFLTAARRMTHESQQHEIMRGFERIRRVTGWDATDFLHSLQEEWGFLES
ncbi:unnamed protein product [Penicillium pancosmium]